MSAASGVARLFVALPVPALISARLGRFRPAARAGIRPIAEPDLHITLHFLGGMATTPVRECLRTVDLPAFSLRLDRTGCFSRRGRPRILWMGIQPSTELTALHATTGEALRAVGFERESRRYAPHITLARLGDQASAQLVADFEGEPFGENAPDLECTRFALFETRAAAEGARYREIESFPLASLA